MTSVLPDIATVLGDVPLDIFLRRYWERDWVQLYPPDLRLTLGGFDRVALSRIIAYGGLRPRDLRVVRGGVVDADRCIFDAADDASVAAVMAAYADGCTIVVNNVQRRHSGVGYLVRAVEIALGQPVGANAYLTPPSAQGLAPHFDDHDVLVLQIEGAKTWQLHAAPVTLPLRGEHFDLDLSTLGPPTGMVALQAGEGLYLPRGIVHAARTDARSSLHLTLGISAYRGADAAALGGTLDREDPLAPRRAVSPLSSPGGDAATVAALRTLRTRFIGTLVPLEDRGIELIDTIASIGPDTLVRHRAGTVVAVEMLDVQVALHFPGNAILCPPAAAAALQYIVETSVFRPASLPGLPVAARVTLARKLVATGLLVPVDHG